MTLDQKKQIISTLRSKAGRDMFVESELETGTAIQIRALREREGWTQSELAERAGMRQTRISLLENPDYEGSVNVRTLLKLSNAFDVALMVRFVSFGELVDHATNLSEKTVVIPKYDDDTGLREIAEPRPEKTTYYVLMTSGAEEPVLPARDTFVPSRYSHRKDVLSGWPPPIVSSVESHRIHSSVVRGYGNV